MSVESNVHAIAVAAAVSELAEGVICIEIQTTTDTAFNAEEAAKTYLRAGAVEVWMIGIDGTRLVLKKPISRNTQKSQNLDFREQKITIQEAAVFLECTDEAVMVALREGKLPGVKIGKPWVIPRQAFFSGLSDLAISEAEKLRVSKVFAKPNSNPVPKEPAVPSPPTRGRPRFPRTF